MGVEEFSFTAVKKGEATILRVIGEHMGALIGRRGETMESLSYLASLVINRMEGPYVKLGLDVGGYRNKREDDLSALAKRIADRVIRTCLLYTSRASTSRTRCPLAVPPMDWLQGMLLIKSSDRVNTAVLAPSVAAAWAASMPACPAPITTTS